MHFVSSFLLLATALTGILALPSSSALVSRDVTPTCSAYPDHPYGRLKPGIYCSIPLALDCPAFRKNDEKYNSQHQTPELKAEFGAFGYPMANYDGITEVWIKSLEKRQQVVESECWNGVREDAYTLTE